MNGTYLDYAELLKPAFAPPAWLFGPVWTFLYLLIALSFGFVFFKCWKKELPWMIFLPFGLNLVFNGLFTPLQFGLKNLWLATADILLVILTLAWAMKVIWPHYKWVAYAQLPYFAWGLFATILQLTITALNV